MKNTFRVLFMGMLLLLSQLASADEPVAVKANPHVIMETTAGTIELELYADKAPKTVANFLRYVNEGFYNGTIFHRVIRGFMIQGGGFDENLTRKETHEPVANEADNGLKNTRGTIAMARTMDPQSATAQFFINTVNNRPLDFTRKTMNGWGYCVFGKVVSGMDVVDKIETVRTGAKGVFGRDVPQTTMKITKVSIK